MQIERLPLRADQARVEERQGVPSDLNVISRAALARDDVAGVDGLRGLAADAYPNAQQSVGGRRLELSIVRDSVREQLGGRKLEGNGENVEAGEDIFNLRAARPCDSAEVAFAEVDEIENALLVELIRIVELPGDDAAAVAETLNERVDEGLVV